MSKGPGSIQRKLLTIFDSDPNGAWRVDDLCTAIYNHDPEYFTRKKHRVAIIRAGKALAPIRPALDWFSSRGPRHSLTFFHADSVMSYARGWMKSDGFYDTEERLVPGGMYHKDIVEGGTWWLRVEHWKAEHKGDTARLAELQPLIDKEKAEMDAMLRMIRAQFGT